MRISADVAELVDALASGASALRGVEVQVLSSVPSKLLSKSIPVETGWVAVPDVEQRSPTRVGVVRVVGLVGVSPAGGSTCAQCAGSYSCSV